MRHVRSPREGPESSSCEDLRAPEVDNGKIKTSSCNESENSSREESQSSCEEFDSCYVSHSLMIFHEGNLRAPRAKNIRDARVDNLRAPRMNNPRAPHASNLRAHPHVRNLRAHHTRSMRPRVNDLRAHVRYQVYESPLCNAFESSSCE